MNLAEFFVKIGVSGQESIKTLNTAINNTRNAVLTMQVAFIGATYAINKFISGTNVQATSLENFQTQTGLAIDELNRWVSAGQKVNRELNFDTVKNNVAGLQKQLEQIKIGQGNIAPFQLLGIDIMNTNAFGVLNQLRENIKGLSDAQAVNLIQQLGLDANFINVLRLSEQEFDKLSKNSFLTGKQITSIANLGRTVNDLKIRLQTLKDQAVVKLAPILMKFLNDFTKWVNQNSRKIVQTFTDIANIISKIGIIVGRVAGLFAHLFENILKSENGFTNLAIIIGALMLSFKPLSLLLIGLLLILEDIAVWRMGGISAFGDLYQAISDLMDKIKEIPGIEHLLKIGGALAGITLLTGGLGKMSAVLTGIAKKATIFVGAFFALKEITEWIKKATEMPNIVPTNEKEVQEKIDWADKMATKITNWIADSKVGTALGLNRVSENRMLNTTMNNQFYITGNNANEISDYIVDKTEDLILENQLKN